MSPNICPRCNGSGMDAAVLCSVCAGRGALGDSRVLVTPHLVKDLLFGGGQIFLKYRRIISVTVIEMPFPVISTELS